MNKRNITIKAFDFFEKNSTEFELILVAVEIDTPENIGSLIRIASNIGCKKVLFPTSKEYNPTKIRRTSTNAFDKMNWEYCDIKDWENNIPDDYQIVAVETGKNATNIYQTELPKKIAIVVGNESYGLRDNDIKKCDSTVFIPAPGIVKSLNVTQAAAVSLFEWYRQNAE